MSRAARRGEASLDASKRTSADIQASPTPTMSEESSKKRIRRGSQVHGLYVGPFPSADVSRPRYIAREVSRLRESERVRKREVSTSELNPAVECAGTILSSTSPSLAALDDFWRITAEKRGAWPQYRASCLMRQQMNRKRSMRAVMCA